MGEPEESPERPQYGGTTLLGIVGFACHISWIILFLLSPVSMRDDASSADTQILKLILLLALAAAFAVTGALSDVFKSPARLRMLMNAGIVLGPLASAATFVVDIPGRYVLTAVAGVGYVCLSLVWGMFLATLRHQRLNAHTANAMALGGSACVLAAAMRGVPALALVVLLAIASSVTIAVLSRSLFADFTFVSVAASRARYRIPRNSMWTSALTGVVLGVGGACLISSGSGLATRMLVAGVLVLCVGIFATFRESDMTEPVMLKIWVPRAALGMLPIPFVGSTGHLICGAYLLFAFAWDGGLVLNATVESARFNQLAPVRTFGEGGAWTMSGVLLGWLLTFVVLDVLVSPTAQTIAVLALVYVVILAAAFVFKDSYPTMEPEVVVIPAADKNDVRRLHRRVEAVAQRYELSARQEEVLVLLAKGRNAEYIQKTFYISKGTAKAHIYNIYRKTGVHSHQELIDLIESTEPAAASGQ